MSTDSIISGQYVDIVHRITYPARVRIRAGKIHLIEPVDQAPPHFILPGFIDAHIHIESSMLVPSQFAKAAVKHGTVGTISDPHEIANVCGVDGVLYMIDNANTVPLKFHFGVPSCVPATNFETAGAQITAADVAQLLQRKDIYYLAEVMNFPGVIHNDPSLTQMIEAAKKMEKPIDGHAPGLRLPASMDYFNKGISTDHECTSLEEALEKVSLGCKILIREGSAAKNFDALHPLLSMHPEAVMFCSDDKHPDDLILGHINQLVRKSIALGYDLYDVLYAACIHPIKHYNMNVGMMRNGDAADFIILKDWETCEVIATWIEGECVYEGGEVKFESKPANIINQFNAVKAKPEDFRIMVRLSSEEYPIIEAIDGSLLTNTLIEKLNFDAGEGYQSNPNLDVLKIAVVNRYHPAPISVGFVKGFGIRNAAIASSVAHDSHNIIVVGDAEDCMCKAVNAIIENKGGIAYADQDRMESLALPVAGLMCDEDASHAAQLYASLTDLAVQSGSTLAAPYMTLSFMALPVIPSLKITDLGIFDVDKFEMMIPVSANKIK